MIGLIQKYLLSSGIRIKHVMYLIFSLIIISLFLPINDFVPLITYSIILFAPVTVILGNMNHTEMDYYKAEIILPLKRSSIVLSKFVAYFVVFIFCIPVIALFLGLNYSIGKTQLETYELSLIMVGFGMTFLFSGILFPLLIIFEQKNIKGIGVAAFVATIVPVRLFMEIMKIVLNLDSVFEVYYYKEIQVIYIMFCFVFYILSCVLSIKIFKKKEF